MTAPVAAEGTDELREAMVALIAEDRAGGWQESTPDELTDALLAGPLAPLLAKVQAVEALADELDREMDEAPALHRSWSSGEIARLLRRALSGDSHG